MSAFQKMGLLVIFALVLNLPLKAETPDSATLKPNVIQGHVGFFGLWGTAHVSYERLLFSYTGKRLNHFYLQSGAGGFVTWGSSGSSFQCQLKGVTGAKNNHFEWGGGLAVLFDKLSYDIDVRNSNYPYPGYEEEPSRLEHCILIPAFTAGYRYQKPGGHFVFRTGLASPDGVYLSLGVAF